jgi:hypothetical protein
MTTSRVADNGDTVEVKFDTVGDERRKMVDTSGDVLECSWPSTSECTYPTVLYIPNGKATSGEILCDESHLVTTVWHPPKSSMQKTYNRRSLLTREI